jgi:hypothetical protein
MPPSGGIPLQNRSRWSWKCPRVPREHSPSLGHVMDVPRVIPDSACSGRLSNPSEGPAVEPLISMGSEPECSGAVAKPRRAQPSNP